MFLENVLRANFLPVFYKNSSFIKKRGKYYIRIPKWFLSKFCAQLYLPFFNTFTSHKVDRHYNGAWELNLIRFIMGEVVFSGQLI